VDLSRGRSGYLWDQLVLSRFRPKGYFVCRSFCHLASVLRRRYGVSVLLSVSCSIGSAVKCFIECCGWLKCIPIGVCLLSLMAERWSFILFLRSLPVSPTYCRKHFWQVIR